MNFKQFLAEGITLTSLDVTKLDLDELLEIYENTGYEVSDRDRDTFLEAFYGGFTKRRQHVYYVACEDLDEKKFYVSEFYIELGPTGKLNAEPSGMPVKYDLETEEEAIEEAEKLAKH